MRAALAASPSLGRLRAGQVKLSWMAPGTRVRPHAGPTDLRLRLHCTVALPHEAAEGGGEEAKPVATFRVGDEPPRPWPRPAPDGGAASDGGAAAAAGFDACFVFREACEHAVRVSPRALGPRVVFIADFANPFLADVDLLLPDGGGRAATAAALAERDAFRERWARQQQQELLQQGRHDEL